MQLLVPQNTINEILKETYNGTSSGHFGINKMLNKIRERFCKFNQRDVKNWCRKRLISSAIKRQPKGTKGK